MRPAIFLLVGLFLAGCAEPSQTGQEPPVDLVAPNASPLEPTGERPGSPPPPPEAAPGCRWVPKAENESFRHEWTFPQDGNQTYAVPAKAHDVNLTVNVTTTVRLTGFLVPNDGQDDYQMSVAAPNGTVKVMTKKAYLVFFADAAEGPGDQVVQTFTRFFVSDGTIGWWSIHVEGRGVATTTISTVVHRLVEVCDSA
jgi:hypothetical protein